MRGLVEREGRAANVEESIVRMFADPGNCRASLRLKMIHRVAKMSDETSPCPSLVAAVADGSGDLFSLRGRRALVTGAGQGIGFALARGLGAAGAEVLLNDVDPARLEQAVAALRGEGLVVHGRCFDVTNGADVERSVAEIERGIGPVDIVINNAGTARIDAAGAVAGGARCEFDQRVFGYPCRRGWNDPAPRGQDYYDLFAQL